MSYNISNITGTSSLFDLAMYASNATSGLFFGIIIIAFFFVIVLNLRERGIDDAIAAASFSSLIISALMAYLGFVNPVYPIVFAAALAGVLMYKQMS